MPIRSSLASAILALLLASASSARAEDVANDPGVFNVYASLGIDGGVQVEDSEDDLENGFGLGFLYAKSLHENFLLGGTVSFISWLGEGNGNDDRDRNLLINAGVRPEGVFPVADSTELFAAGMIGLVFSQIGEDDFGLGEIQPALGVHLGLAFGARFALQETQGLQLELALQRHQAEHEIDTLLGDFEADSELDIGMLNLGYYFR